IGKVLPIAAKYGAMLILLPLDDNGLPETCQDRIINIHRLFVEIAKYNYSRKDVAVDALIMAVSAAPAAGNAALDFIDYCHNSLKVNTVCGLSNISFGLPNRMLVNRTFLTMAMTRGLNMAIANPMNEDFMNAIDAVEALNMHDEKMKNYLAKQSNAAAPAVPAAAADPAAAAYNAVLHGDAALAVKAVKNVLEKGDIAPRKLLNEYLLKAIADVGEKFEKKQYFLPQLLAGAEALQMAIKELESALAEDNEEKVNPEKFIIATVRGDIHDIGKNITALMLRNSGFEVIDLGKDVPAEAIVERALKENCRIVGLSALMTTTMTEMPKVIELARERGCQAQFIVGGAVVDEKFAESINAAYAADAMMCVRVARELMQK
ncbi:MAG: cobalamin-dependent protein, partial [Lentisphaeria bacterium]|nr:cobalamin-dependent protein [Lentisphaeria bacterium]